MQENNKHERLREISASTNRSKPYSISDHACSIMVVLLILDDERNGNSESSVLVRLERAKRRRVFGHRVEGGGEARQ